MAKSKDPAYVAERLRRTVYRKQARRTKTKNSGKNKENKQSKQKNNINNTQSLSKDCTISQKTPALQLPA